MKTRYRNIIAAGITVLCAAGFTACDDVAEDDRYILGGEITAERAVLLEDFTGQTCLNCPDAHEVIEQLEEQFGSDKVIAVSIHCGTFGLSTDRTKFDVGRVGLMTAEGNAIMEAYGIESFPMGVIDGGKPTTFDLWPTAVRNALQVPTDVDIELECDYAADSKDGDDGWFGTIEVKAVVSSHTDHSDANIQFWIVENGIVAAQKHGAQTIPDYVHNNVFRGQVFDGLRGQSLSIRAGFDTTVEGSIANRWTDKEHWNINNISVVAFVSDKTGVLQVIRKPLVTTNDNEE